MIEIVVSIVFSLMMGFTVGVLFALAGVLSRDKKAVKRKRIEINGEIYNLTKITERRSFE